MPLTPYQPDTDRPWDLRRVVHLHRRAGLGASWDLIQRDLREGHEAAIGRLLDARITDDAELFSLTESIGSAAVASGDSDRLKAWWLLRMLKTPDPLGERLALMWHSHFAVSNLKVDDPGLMKDYLHAINNHSRSGFRELISAVVKSPAMLVWLDADANRRGRPNENLARELMELFTLGIGHYTENDVKAAARSLTGWSVRERKFAFRENRHDADAKTILGRTEHFDGDLLLSCLCDQEATADRIAWRLCQTFLGENMTTREVVSAVATTLRKSSLNINTAVSSVLSSQTFFSEANIRSRVAGPAEYVVSTLRSLNLTSPPPRTLKLAGWCEKMGQNLFFPPNVGGWNEGRSWLSTRTVIARQNFNHAVATGSLWARPPSVLSRKDVTSAAHFHAVLLGDSKKPEVPAYEALQAAFSDPRNYLN